MADYLQVRAAVAESRSGPLRVQLIGLDRPRNDEVLIKMVAAGLCHSDLARFDGSRTDWPDYPMVLGHEGSGIVLECGSDVGSVKAGDHVIPVAIPECGVCPACRSGLTNICDMFNSSDVRRPFRRGAQDVRAFCEVGAFADHIVTREIQVTKIRPDAPLDLVCCLGCAGMTGLGAVLFTAKVRAGATVVVFGVGGIGVNVIHGARIAGARLIVALDTNPAKQAVAEKAGAHHFIDPASANRDIVDLIRELTAGGADYAFECVGQPTLLRQAVESTRRGWGTTVMIGVPSSGQDIALRPHAVLEGRQVMGSYLGNVKTRSQLPQLVDLCMDGKVDLNGLISHRFELDDIARGFELMKSNAMLRGIICF